MAVETGNEDRKKEVSWTTKTTLNESDFEF